MSKFFDDSTDDEKYEACEDSSVLHNSFDYKSKEVVKNGDKLIDHSNDHLYHLDDFKEDENLDEEFLENIHNKNNISDDGENVNIDDLSHEASYSEENNNNYINDEAEEDLHSSHTLGSESIKDEAEEDLHSSQTVRSESDGDEDDSFIDDESLGYYSTDDEDNDDDF